jgi:hypothetical protein
MASAKVDGQDPPINNEGIQSRERLVFDQERGVTSTSLSSSSAHDIERALKLQKGALCPTAEM